MRIFRDYSLWGMVLHDPVSLAVASLATTAVGAGVSAYGQAQSAQYQAAVARNNAAMAANNAKYALDAGEVQAQDQGMKDAQAQGRAKALAGASGLDMSSGSFNAVFEGNAESSNLNQLRIRNDAQMKAYGFNVQGENFSNDAGLAEMKGNFGVATSLLGGLSSVSDKWSGFKEKGIF